MKYCGIALTPRRIVAALNGPAGACDAFRVPRHHTARYNLLAAVGVHPCTLVMEDVSWREDPIGEVALTTGNDVWIAPHGLVAAIIATGGMTDSPERRAEILSRLPVQPWTRGYLRPRRRNGDDPRQQKLW